MVETNTGVFVSLTDTGTDPNNPDTDLDGCTDGQELGLDEKRGGRRDPNNYWDFFDTDFDRAISFLDLLGIMARFNTTDDGGLALINRFSDPITTADPGPGNYHPRYDRGGITPGGDPWDEQPADGSIGFFDLLSFYRQFNHSCIPLP